MCLQSATLCSRNKSCSMWRSAERRTSTIHDYKACQKILHHLVWLHAENEHYMWFWKQSSVPRFAGGTSFSVFNGRTVNKAIRLPDLCSVYFWHVVRTEGFCNSTECQEVCSTLSPKRSQAGQRFSGNCTCSHPLIYGTHFLDQPHLAA